MNAPTTFRAGDSITWTDSLAAYPADDGWALKYKLLWPSGSAVEIATTPAGADHAVALTSANTAAWVAGSATLLAYVEKGAIRATLASDPVTIQPNLVTATSFDGRSIAVRSLADARAARSAYLLGGKAHVAEYDIAGRRMKFRTVKEIGDLIEQLEREVARERAAQALLEGGTPGRVQVRF
jgi:hypothetical protein